MDDKVETPESRQLDVLNNRKRFLEMNIRDIETERRANEKVIQEKCKEIDMLEYLIAKLKEREEE